MILKCWQCNETIEPDLSWSGNHIKASCSECKKYIQFVAHDRLDHGDMARLEAWQALNVTEEEYVVTAIYSDGEEQEVGSLSLNIIHSCKDMPVELEIDGVIYKPEF
jgi:hypothetical protein